MPTSWVGIVCFVIASLVTLIGYGVKKIINGDLLPRASYKDQERYYESRLAREKEITDLQAATQLNLVEANRRQTEQLQLLVTEQRTTREVMNALKVASEIAASNRLSGGL